MRVLAPFVALALVAPAAAQTGANAEPIAAAAAIEAAQSAGDRAALDRLIAPEFLITHGSGKIGNKSEYLDGFAGAKTETSEIGDRLFLRVSPDVAIAGAEARTSGTVDGRPFTAHYRYSRTLVRRDGRWLMVYAQVTPLGE